MTPSQRGVSVRGLNRRATGRDFLRYMTRMEGFQGQDAFVRLLDTVR